MKYYVYIVSCKDGHFYTGYTNNIRRRLNQHNGFGYYFWNLGRSYTSKRRPVFLQHLESFLNKSGALKREQEIKKMSHQEKKRLILKTTKEEILSAI